MVLKGITRAEKIKQFLHKAPPSGKFRKGKSQARFFETKPVKKGARRIALTRFSRRIKSKTDKVVSSQESAQDFLLG